VNSYQNIDEVIARILAGEGSAEDRKILDEWLQASPDNIREFEFAQKIFRETSDPERIAFDTDKAWEKVRNQIRAKENHAKVIPLRKYSAAYILRIAAMLVLVAGMAASVYEALTGKLLHRQAAFASSGAVTTSALPDGSVITLNKNSSLEYSENRFSRKKSVTLSGEAYFDIAQDAEGNFLVKAGGLSIEDIGTSFNVRAYQHEKIVIVAVASGEVRVYSQNHDTLHLMAGQAAEYNTETGTFTRFAELDKNSLAYRDKIFVFDNTELDAIVKLLNEIYGSKIIIENDSVKKCRLTASFNNETLDSMLEVIAETLHLTIKRNDPEIILSGDGCN
jgi:ferric-dicitrate binding protein FerR (iron transport regulator)